MITKKRPNLPRAKYLGYMAVIASLVLGGLFVYALFFTGSDYSAATDIAELSSFAYFAVAIPIGLVSIFITGTGFWIGWTILTIKVVPPMPEIVEKKDYSKAKAFLLCLFTFSLAVLLIYGIVIKNFWALAIPAAAITLVILGAIFWVGLAIITTRSTLPMEKKES